MSGVWDLIGMGICLIVVFGVLELIGYILNKSEAKIPPFNTVLQVTNKTNTTSITNTPIPLIISSIPMFMNLSNEDTEYIVTGRLGDNRILTVDSKSLYNIVEIGQSYNVSIRNLSLRDNGTVSGNVMLV